MPDRVVAYIGLGANLGDARASIMHALHAIADTDGMVLTRQSSLYASAPIDADGPDFINAVAQVQTRLSAMQLLEALQAIENRSGRQRPYRNAPRTLDLDILLYGDARIQTAVLTVPHPRMMERAFVLLPLAELAPEHVCAADLQRVQGQVVKRL